MMSDDPGQPGDPTDPVTDPDAPTTNPDDPTGSGNHTPTPPKKPK